MYKLTKEVTARKESDGNTLLILTNEKGLVESIIVNEIGYEILNRCDGKKDQQMIISELEKIYEIDNRSNLEKDVLNFLTNLVNRGWIQDE
ncbi:MAG: PqqD family peptide modification chaperone [Streptococcaceae bacterium]|jgi:hypothetical protein|nr:PqqD family peptide modification chaperone [Streptococcaceae bacterium]